MPIMDPRPVASVTAVAPAMLLLRREQLRRRRRQALWRSLGTASVWAFALLLAAWLMLAGIAGFAHA
jgi:Tfp pilus assembly protein PilN